MKLKLIIYVYAPIQKSIPTPFSFSDLDQVLINAEIERFIEEKKRSDLDSSDSRIYRQ